MATKSLYPTLTLVRRFTSSLTLPSPKPGIPMSYNPAVVQKFPINRRNPLTVQFQNLYPALEDKHDNTFMKTLDMLKKNLFLDRTKRCIFLNMPQQSPLPATGQLTDHITVPTLHSTGIINT
jgi:hypothetical protein